MSIVNIEFALNEGRKRRSRNKDWNTFGVLLRTGAIRYYAGDFMSNVSGIWGEKRDRLQIRTFYMADLLDYAIQNYKQRRWNP